MAKKPILIAVAKKTLRDTAESLGRHPTKVTKSMGKAHKKLIAKEKSLHKKYGEDWTSKMNPKEKSKHGNVHSEHRKSKV